MEHDIEKIIREKVHKAEAHPANWSRQDVWLTLRDSQAPRRKRPGFHYMIAAVAVLVVMFFVYVLTSHEPPSQPEFLGNAKKAIPPTDHSLPKNALKNSTPWADSKQKRKSDPQTKRPTLTRKIRIHPIDSSDAVRLPDHTKQANLAETTSPAEPAQPWDSIEHRSLQQKKVIHAIVGVLEPEREGPDAAGEQKASRLKLFRPHNKELKTALTTESKKVMARIN